MRTLIERIIKFLTRRKNPKTANPIPSGKRRVGRPSIPEDQKAKTLSITLIPSQFAWLDANRGDKSRNQHAAEQIPNAGGMAAGADVPQLPGN